MTAAAIWVLLTIIGELFFLQMDIFGEPVTKQAHFIDEAFILLMVLAIPIFTFVITMIGYIVFKFRAKGDDDVLEDAEPVRTHKKWVGFWLAWTTILCLVVIVHPGYTGIIELRETNDEEPDLTVNVTGRRWQWIYEYEGRDVSLYS